MATDTEIEAGARAICKARDLNPDTLYQVMEGEPDYSQREDGYFFNGRNERQKLIKGWRKYATVARIVIDAVELARAKKVTNACP